MLTTRPNKLECLYLAITLQSGLTFAGNTRSLLKASEMCSNWVGSGFALERVSKDKRSSLLGLVVSDEGKKFYNNDIRSTAEAGERSNAHQETDRYLQSYTSKLDRFSVQWEYISIMKWSSLQKFPFSYWQGFMCLMKPRHDTQHNTSKLKTLRHTAYLHPQYIDTQHNVFMSVNTQHKIS